MPSRPGPERRIVGKSSSKLNHRRGEIMRILGIALVAVLVVESVPAASPEVMRTDWRGFSEQVRSRGLEGRPVRIGLAGAGQAKTRLVRVTESGLEVRSTRALRKWKNSGRNALLPQEQVASVRFEGRTGHRGLIGAAAGLGAGAGIAAVAATSADCHEGACIILFPVLGVAITVGSGVAGYFIGRSTAPHLPEFILTH